VWTVGRLKSFMKAIKVIVWTIGMTKKLTNVTIISCANVFGQKYDAL
jgi:hypothetical protein